MFTNSQSARSTTVTTLDTLWPDWLPRIKPRLEIETKGFLKEKTAIHQQYKSSSSYISFVEKFIAVLGVMLVSVDSMLETVNKRSGFLSNNYLLQSVNSVLPFIVSNLSSSLAILRQIDTNQGLLVEYQQAYKNYNKHLYLNRYPLMIKIGLRAAFKNNLPVARRLEADFIDQMTEMYFSGKKICGLNQSLKTALEFLEENPVPTRRYLKMLVFALLSAAAIGVAYFGSDVIHSSSIFAIIGLVTTAIVSTIILASHFLEHSTLLAPAVKKRVNWALEEIGSVEKQAECLTSGLLVQLRQEEIQYLEQQFAQLTSEHVLMLVGVISEDASLLQGVQPVPAVANSWSFFKHHSVYVKERSLENIQQEYCGRLAALEAVFDSIRNELTIMRARFTLSLSNQVNLNFILSAVNNFEEALVEIYTSLVNLTSFIQASNVPGLEEIAGLINEFKRQYVPFLACKDEYNAAAEDMTYLRMV